MNADRKPIALAVASPGFTDTIEIWTRAAGFDPTIRFRTGHLPTLQRKRVLPRRFSRRRLFQGMAAGKVTLLSGLQVLADAYGRSDPTGVLVDKLRAFPKTETASVITGLASRRQNLPVADLVERWERRRARVSVTDLHIRDTALEEVIDTSVLSNFNILRKGSEDMAWHEMMTMVVSTEGHVTDSHSDDPDGSNHCFAGRKLWLAWDTFEGQAHGLQDVERDYVADRARFDLKTFLRLRSSRWFIVSPGLTLFLPGHLTHKVITLEHYLGVGSFYVALPNCVRTISRWRVHGPLWSEREREGNNAALVSEIARTSTAFITHVSGMPTAARYQWGFPFLRESVRLWKADVPARTRASLLTNPDFKALVTEACGGREA